MKLWLHLRYVATCTHNGTCLKNYDYRSEEYKEYTNVYFNKEWIFICTVK